MFLYKIYFDELFRVEGEPLKACSSSKDHLLNYLLGEGWPVDRRTLCFTEHLNSLGSGVRIAWVQTSLSPLTGLSLLINSMGMIVPLV